MSTPASQDGGRKHTAGAYDVRIFIAGLIGFYGIVLVLMGLFADDATPGPRPATSTPTCGPAWS